MAIPTWPALLRQARTQQGLSQAALAEQAGVSAATIASYESGRRPPTRAMLLRLTRGLQLETASLDPLLIAVGLEPEPSARLAALAARRLSRTAIQQQLDSYPWPCLVTNERMEVVTWNAPATWVAELDFAADRPRLAQRQMLRLMALPHFRQRLLNWDDVALLVIGLYKDDAADIAEPEARSPYFVALIEDLSRQYPDVLARLLDLWDRAQPRGEESRITYRTDWQSGDGTVLHFNCVITSLSDFDGAWALDWHPADGTTWLWLANQRGRAAPTPVPPVERAWQATLRQAREATGLTRNALADATGLSAPTLYSYETGKRRPRRESLLRLTRALGLDGVTTNDVLTVLSLPLEPADWALLLASQPVRTKAFTLEPPTEAIRRARALTVQLIAGHPWPCLLIDGDGSIMATNGPATRVLAADVPQGASGLVPRTVAELVHSEAFRTAVSDWETVSAALLGYVPLNGAEDTLPRASQPNRFATRVVLPIVWRTAAGTVLRFNGILSPWLPYDATWAVDWHPADGATWNWLVRSQ